MTLRIIFAGSPAVAVPHLVALVHAGFNVVAVVTRDDSPVGRKRVMSPTPVAVEAGRLGIPVIKANSLRHLTLPDADLGVVVAYGGLVPPDLLAAPTHGWINVHFSVLPEYRGAAPLQRALWDGKDETGVTIFRLVDELDAGPVFMSRSIPFEESESASSALDRVGRETTHDLVATARLISVGGITPVVQTGLATTAPKFTRADGHVNWELSADLIARRIRAVTTEPGAFAMIGDLSLGITEVRVSQGSPIAPGELVVDANRVVVGTGDGLIELQRVRPAGKGEMSAADWARGLRDSVRFE